MKPTTPLIPAILLLASLPAQRVVGTGGAAYAVGPGYTAAFAPGGMTFLRTAGDTDSQPFHWRLDAVRRGSVEVWRRHDDCAPQIAGNSVRHAHQGGPVETYDVRDDGVEQRFVFATRPAGSGDLVVAGTIRTDLPLLAAGEDCLRFGASAAAITFGAVTGVDANGATVRGGMRVVGDTLELSLPAAFVDSATYPLVLDPLIGTPTLVAASPASPNVAYDATTDRYFVVWGHNPGAGGYDIRGQLVSSTGTLISTPVTIATGASAIAPVVANVNGADHFVVAWTKITGGLSYGVQARAVAAGAAVMSNVLTRNAPVLADVSSLAIGGDSRAQAGGGRAMVTAVIDNVTASTTELWGWAIDVASGSVLSSINQATFPSAPSAFVDVAITQQCIQSGHWLIAYTMTFTYGQPTDQIRCFLIDENGTACQNFGVVTPGGPLASHPAVAAYASSPPRFVIAWQDDTSATIRTRRMERQGTCGSGGWLLTNTYTPLTLAGLHDQPSLTFATDKCLLAWRHRASGTAAGHVYVTALATTGARAGNDHQSNTSGSFQAVPAIVGKAVGGGTNPGDEGLMVFSNGSIRAQRVEATGTGTVTNLGGACGVTGFNDYASYSGTPVIGSTFTMQLLSPTSPVVALVVGFTATPLACGPCTLVPSPDLMLGALASANVGLPPDPGLIGVDLYAQWVQWRPGGCPTYPTLGVSNALRFTIAE